MASPTSMSVFVYAYHVSDDSFKQTEIRVYALTKKNTTVCLRIDDFMPSVYIDLTTPFGVTSDRALKQYLSAVMSFRAPKHYAVVMKKSLYGSESQVDRPFLKCTYPTRRGIYELLRVLKNPHTIGEQTGVVFKVLHGSADSLLQFRTINDLPPTGWVSFKGIRATDDEKVTTLDYEYLIKSSNIHAVKADMELYNVVPKPLIMSFDLEVNSANPTRMCNASIAEDVIFLISCVFTRGEDNDSQAVLLTLFEPDETLLQPNTQVVVCASESSLLLAFAELVSERRPNIITGYNIIGFDIEYMIKRARSPFLYGCFGAFAEKLTYYKCKPAPEKTIKWSSSAFGTQEFQYLESEGIVYVDLLPLIKRDYKLRNYKLKTVAEYFLNGASKDPLSPKGIFLCYRLGRLGKEAGATPEDIAYARKATAVCGKYCIQDSALVIHLMNTLQTFLGLCEMSRTTNVTLATLIVKGQQVKVFSQVFAYCHKHGRLVDEGYAVTGSDERYAGAHVFSPVPGLYDAVVPFDFASLYPSLMIAYNIDYSTWVTDVRVPDEKCHLFDWEDHYGCAHDEKVIRKNELLLQRELLSEEINKLREKRDKLKIKRQKTMISMVTTEISNDIANFKKLSKIVSEEIAELTKSISKRIMCAKRHYRFLKEPKGVLPSVLQGLLDARKHTRQQLREIGKDDGTLALVLDKRQLSYKVSCNSMYGAMGVREGYLPFMPGAMCTTYMGRTSIVKVSQHIPQHYQGKLIYGDSDSNYITFPHLKSSSEIWKYAEFVSKSVSDLFPPPMKLEFEDVIYWQFLILSKKRYMYRKCDEAGNVDTSIGNKGVILARRDNATIVRTLYEHIVQQIFAKVDVHTLYDQITCWISATLRGDYDYKNFIITKSIKSTENATPGMLGEYKVKTLPLEPDLQSKAFIEKGVTTEAQFYESCLPAHVQLAEKMRRRGQRVEAGSRIEYLFVTQALRNNLHDKAYAKLKQVNKIEAVDYFLARKSIFKIDYLEYIHQMCVPIDQLLKIAPEGDRPRIENFMDQQYKIRLAYQNVLIDLILAFRRGSLGPST